MIAKVGNDDRVSLLVLMVDIGNGRYWGKGTRSTKEIRMATVEVLTRPQDVPDFRFGRM